MTIPYTYILKHIPSGKVYYGCRYAKNCSPNDLWTTYFTSSKYIKDLINKDGKESFLYEIRKIFNSVDECRIWEHKVLKRLNAINRQNVFINKTDNISISPEACSLGAKGKTGLLCPAYGRKNKKLSEYNKNKTGEKHHFYNKGETTYMYGRKGELHPNFGKKNPRSKKQFAEQATCPHCNKTGHAMNMYRWHFKNCKLIKKD